MPMRAFSAPDFGRELVKKSSSMQQARTDVGGSDGRTAAAPPAPSNGSGGGLQNSFESAIASRRKFMSAENDDTGEHTFS